MGEGAGSGSLAALRKHRGLQAEWQELAGDAWEKYDYVFCTPLGRGIHPNTLQHQFQALLKRVGLPAIRFHDLRHSVATLLLSRGVHPKVVQEILGHSQISITMDVYSHVMPAMHKDAMSELNHALADLDEGANNDDEDDESGGGLARK